jgi:hypothetical protein
MTRVFFLSTLVLLSNIFSFAQSNYFTVSGKVLYAESKLPMQGASVFAENTTLGTTTDQEGNFVLQLPAGGYDLIISFTGYQSEQKRINASETLPLQFELNPKEKMMQEVSIVSTGEVKEGWKKYGQFFLEEFLGKSANRLQCNILNTQELKFFFSKKKNRLKVMSNEPLIIENNALGYTIKYALDSFTHEYNTEVSLYSGNPLFEEKTAASVEEADRWKAARKLAYNGSVLHFMRSIYNGQLEDEGFEIQFLVKVNNADSALRLKDFYRALNAEIDDSTETVEIRPNQNEVGVIYTKEKPAEKYLSENTEEPKEFQFSILSFKPDKILTIEKNGFYYEQNDLTTKNYWTWEKMADALPYDYVP